jgi:hypothetical protein
MLTLNKIVEEYDEKRNSMTNISTPMKEDSPKFSRVKSISHSSTGSKQMIRPGQKPDSVIFSHSAQEKGLITFPHHSRTHYTSNSIGGIKSHGELHVRKGSDSFTSDVNKSNKIPKFSDPLSYHNFKSQFGCPDKSPRIKAKFGISQGQSIRVPQFGGVSNMIANGKHLGQFQHQKTKTWSEFDYKNLVNLQKSSYISSAAFKNDSPGIGKHRRYASDLINAKNFSKQEPVKAKEGSGKTQPKIKKPEEEENQLAVKMHQLEKKLSKMAGKVGRIETENQFLKNKVEILSKQSDLSQMVDISLIHASDFIK